MTEFSRTQTLVSRIRQILREYPCGDTIIFELVQNADDAKATSAKIVIDPGSGTGSTAADQRDEALGWSPCMTATTNPALYFYNSGVFTDRDLKNIQRIGGDDATSKRHDATKVGRFGIGFNSTFHLSDVVIFVSGRHLVAMDPACAHLPLRDGKAVDGVLWDFLDFETDDKISDQEKHFVRAILGHIEKSGLGFNRKEEFAGTIFRLALRQKPSDFWRVVHPVENVMKLISDFFYSARVSMVLLKNVTSIDASILSRDPTAETMMTLQSFYSVSATWPAAVEAVEARGSIVTWLSKYTAALHALIQATDDVTVSIDSVDSAPFQAMLPEPFANQLEVAIDFSTGPAFEREPGIVGSVPMHVHHQLGPGGGWEGSEVWALADRAARLQDPLFVPWAAAISEGGVPVNGRTLCFFPIQGHSQLPVHVHGYFHLSSDRQSIVSVERSKWNKALADEIASHAIANGIQARCAAKLPSYKLWPTASYTDSTITAIANATIDLLADMDSIVTSGGGLAKPADALFVSDESRKVHEHLLQLASNVATCADLDAEGLGALTAIAHALDGRSEKRGTKGVVHYAGAADYRRLVASSGASDTVEDVGVAIALLYRCAEDGDVAAVAAMGLATPVALLPMEDGSVRPWSADAASDPPLLLAKTKEEHDLLALLPGAAGRLVRWLDAGSVDDSDDAESEEAVESAVDGAAHHHRHFLDVADAGLALKMCVKVRKLLLSLLDRQYAMAAATPDFLVQAIQLSLDHEPCFRAQVELGAQDRGGGAYDFLPCPSTNPDARIPGDLLFRVFEGCVNAPGAFELPLLPVFPAGEAEPAHQQTLPMVVPAISCLGPNVPLCVPATTSPAIASMAAVLTALGARKVITDIVPPHLAHNWRLPDTTAGQVYVLEPASRAAAAALDACRAIGDGDGGREAPSPCVVRDALASGDGTVAEGVLLYFASALDSLVPADREMLRHLPVFKDFREGLVDIVPPTASEKDGSEPLNPVSLPRAGVPQPFLAALERDDAPSYSVLHGQTLLAVPPVPLRPLFKALGVAEATLGDMQLAAAPSLPPASDGATSTSQHAANAAWRTVIHELGVAGCTAEATALRRAAVSSLKRHAFLPASHEPRTLLTAGQCINPAALEKHPAVRELLDAMASAAVAPQLLRVPRLSCIAQRDRSTLDAALRELGAAERLDSAALVVVIRAFAAVVSKGDVLIPEHVSRYAASLLAPLDNAEYMGDEDWEHLKSVKFVPVVANNDDNDSRADVAGELCCPADCVFPEVYALNPRTSKRRIAMEALSDPAEPNKAPALRRCGAKFGWDVKPSIKDMVDFLNWTRSTATSTAYTAGGGDDGAAARRAAKGMWDVYAVFEEALRTTPTTHAELRRVEYIYLPDREIAVHKQLCAQDEGGRGLEPHLWAIDHSVVHRFPKFFQAIGVPLKHQPEQVVSVIAAIVDACPNSALSDDQRKSIAALLEYLVKQTPAEEITAVKDQVFVPTSDGRAALARDVMYDFFDLSNRAPKADVMHACVSSNVARGLRMQHSGAKYVERLRSRSAEHGALRRAKMRGPRLSLANGIKRILNDYSDHQAVLLEMLQNADDAGATTIEFYLDTRTFPTEKEGLLGAGMAACQGAALVVRNDAKFTPSDFESIMDVGCGSKADDAMKIGRFGVGFNTVYHVTDCPSLVSGTNVLFFDPTMAHIDGVAADNPGMMIDFSDDATDLEDLASQLPHQFAPYARYGADMRSPHEGTLFRLPLRKKAAAQSASQLSAHEWSPSSVRDMFDNFAPLLKTAMLFLKSVVSIRLHEVSDDGTETLLHGAELTNRDAVVAHRSALRDFIVKHPTTEASSSPDAAVNQTCDMHVSVTGRQPTSHRFRVSSRVKSPQSMPDKLWSEIPSELRAKLVQWASVATEVHVHQGRYALPQNSGTLACFLPLPVATGAPYWLHGYFTLSSDRRNLAVDGFGAEGTGQSWEMKWNAHILAMGGECLAESLHSLAAEAAEASAVVERRAYYDLWPLEDRVSAQLRPMVSAFFRHVVATDREVLWSSKRRPVAVAASLFIGDDIAFEFNLQTLLEDLFSGSHLVTVGKALSDQLIGACVDDVTSPTFVSPKKVGNVLMRRAQPAGPASWIPLNEVFPSLSSGTTVASANTSALAALVSYVTKGDGESVVPLHRMPLLLLEASTEENDEARLGIIDPANTVFVVPPESHETTQHIRHVFPQFEGVLNREFWKRVSDRGNFDRKFWEAHSVVDFTVENLAMCFNKDRMRPCIEPTRDGSPRSWNGPAATSAVLAGGGGPPRHLSDTDRQQPAAAGEEGDDAIAVTAWLEAVWACIRHLKARPTHGFNHSFTSSHANNKDWIRALGSWPLIPVKRSGDHFLVPASQASTLLSGFADAPVLDVLSLVGVAILDTGFGKAADVLNLCGIPTLEAATVADSVLAAQRDGRFGDRLTVEHRHVLRKYFIQAAAYLSAQRRAEFLGKVHQLEIFEVVDESGGWAFEAMYPHSQQALAVPDGVPVTAVCRGLHREPIPELGIHRCDLRMYLTQWFFPLYDRQGAMPRSLSLQAELEHWRIYAKEIDQKTFPNAAEMQRRQVVPIKPSSIPALKGERSKCLADQCIRFIVRRGMPYVTELSEAKQDGMIRRIAADEVACLATETRAKPADCALPLRRIPDAPIPDAIRVINDRCGSTVRMIPEVLWRDECIRKLLQRCGVNSRSANQSILAAAESLHNLLKQGTNAHRAFLAAGDEQTPDWVYLQLHDLGVSVCLAAAEFGDADCINVMRTWEFLLPPPMFVVHKQEVRARVLKPCAPQNMLRHQDAALAFTQKAVCNPLLDDERLKQLVPPPTTQDVVKHLAAFGDVADASGPQARLGTAEAIDATLDDIFRVLATANTLTQEPCRTLLLKHPVFPVPRRIVDAFAARFEQTPTSATGTLHSELQTLLSMPKSFRKLVPHSWIVPGYTTRSLAPFVFQAQDFAKGTATVLNGLPSLKALSPTAVIERVGWAATALSCVHGGDQGPRVVKEVYASLLQRLISAAREKSWNLPRLVSGPSASDVAAEMTEFAQRIRSLPIPVQAGGFIRLEKCTAPDTVTLLRRCDKSRLHLVDSDVVSLYTCRELGIPSAHQMLSEVPVKAEALARTAPVDAWNKMLRAAEFTHAIARILETERLASSDALRGKHGPQVLTDPAVKKHLEALRCERVASIVTAITDQRQPSIDLAAATSADDSSCDNGGATSAFQPLTSTIFLVLRDESTKKGKGDRCSAPFLLAEEINAVLHGAIGNVAPLAAVCSLVADRPVQGIHAISGLLDRLRCVSVDMPTVSAAA